MDAFVTRLSPRGDRIVYSTFVGGSGETYSFDFPTTPGALERSKAPDYTGVAVKLNPSGTALVYGTYLTGSAQVPYGIAVDGSGQAVIVGHIAFDMRTTIGSGAATTFGDGFIIRLNATGSAFVYSRRFGGSHYDAVNDVAVDAWGWAHVTGHTWSTDFMVSPDAFQPEIASTNGGPDAFVAALSPDGRTVRNATYLGGSAADEGISITVTSQTWVTVVGYTYSTDFPTRDAIQPALAGEGDAFVATLFVGRDLVHGTYLGGRGTEHVNGGAVDGAGRITVAGSTHSTDFPTTSAIQKTNRSPETNEGYVARVGLILPGTIQAPDVSIRVADDATLYGNWQNIFEDAVGRVLHNPDARLARLAAPLAAPFDYFEFTVDGLSNQAWRMWIRGKAQNDSYTNDSVWVQFSNAVVWDDADQSTPAYQIGSTQGVAVVLEECSGCGVRGWGWQDNGYGPAVLGPVIEFGEGPTTVRVQRREDGISIDQIVFARAGATRFDDSPYFVWAPGYQMDDTTLLPPRAGGDPEPGDEDVLIYAGVDSPQLHGAWRVEADPTAAGGKKIRHPNGYLSKITTPLASPTHYVEFSFEAKADVPYGFFIRGRADRDDPYNDSVHVQATNTLFPIGSTSAMTINLEQCAGTGLHGWMWRSSNYCNAPDDPEPGALVFSTDGPQTIRIQTREDGISIDQILMSRRYLDHGPHEPIIPR
jgi:hypothetical protein